MNCAFIKCCSVSKSFDKQSLQPKTGAPGSAREAHTASAREGEKQKRQGTKEKGRRGGVQLTSEKVFEGLIEQFNAMEQLQDAPSRLSKSKSGYEALENSGIEFIRILHPQQFTFFLRVHGVPIEDYGSTKLKTKSVDELWTEVVFRECTLVQVGDPSERSLERWVSVVFLEIEARVEGESRFLLLSEEWTTKSLGRKGLNTRPSKKMFDDEDPEDAVWRCVHQNLNVKEKLAQQLFTIESFQRTREVKNSVGFPGLLTIYDMHVAHLIVTDPCIPEMTRFGLPQGESFRTTTKFIAHSNLRTWTWYTADKFKAAKSASAGIDASKLASSQCQEPGGFSVGGGPGAI